MATLGAGYTQFARGRAVLGRCANCARHSRPVARPRETQRALAPRLNRPFSSSSGGKRPNTQIKWYPIPVGLGIGFLGLVQFYKVTAREKEKQRELENGEVGERPKKRPRVRPDGPWCVIAELLSSLVMPANSR